ASNAWFRSFQAFIPQSQLAFDKCDFGRLAALAYPWVSKEHLRTGCDLMNLFFVIDEYTDVEPAPVVREMVDVVIDALNNPDRPRPEGEILLGKVAQEFWQLGIKTATQSSQRHMVESLTAYLESVVQQAADRDNDTLRTIDSYLHNRRQNIGIRPSFASMELDLDLPDHDIVSYNKEQAVGDDRHNILTIAMRQFDTDFQCAMEWIIKYHAEVEMKFIDGLKRVPSWGPEIDRQMEQYLYGMANWPRCNDSWNFESGRYFGSKGREIQKTRRVPLLPKLTPYQDTSLRRENVIVPFIDTLHYKAIQVE
ncbi:hypothetical protein DXG01_016457, partial [Tephrocybe rancida]